MTLQTRPLGRTGTDVTILSYGAMELRGQPAGPAIEDAEAGLLRLLGTDRLDLVQVHMSPSRAQLEQDETVPALAALRDEGKVRFLGMSGILPHLPDHIAMGVFDVFQRRWDSSGVDDLLDGMPRQEFVLRFTLSHPALSTTIVGTSSVDHLRANLDVAAKGPLPADLYEQAGQRLAAPQAG